MNDKPTRIVGVICVLWRVWFISHFFNSLLPLGSVNFQAAMGGDCSRIESSSCEEFQKNPMVWEHLELGGVRNSCREFKVQTVMIQISL